MLCTFTVQITFALILMMPLYVPLKISQSPALAQTCKVHWNLFLWKTDNNSKQTNKQQQNNNKEYQRFH